jgi:hypothetical protein
MDHLGQRVCGDRLACRLGPLLVVCSKFWHLQQNLWLARRDHRVHDVDVAVDHCRSGRRQAQCRNRASDGARKHRQPAETAGLARSENGRHRRPGTCLRTISRSSKNPVLAGVHFIWPAPTLSMVPPMRGAWIADAHPAEGAHHEWPCGVGAGTRRSRASRTSERIPLTIYCRNKVGSAGDLGKLASNTFADMIRATSHRRSRHELLSWDAKRKFGFR